MHSHHKLLGITYEIWGFHVIGFIEVRSSIFELLHACRHTNERSEFNSRSVEFRPLQKGIKVLGVVGNVLISYFENTQLSKLPVA
jgi:hypothetical protein